MCSMLRLSSENFSTGLIMKVPWCVRIWPVWKVREEEGVVCKNGSWGNTPPDNVIRSRVVGIRSCLSSSVAVAKVLILKIMTVIMTINSSGRIEQRSRGCWLFYKELMEWMGNNYRGSCLQYNWTGIVGRDSVVANSEMLGRRRTFVLWIRGPENRHRFTISTWARGLALASASGHTT